MRASQLVTLLAKPTRPPSAILDLFRTGELGGLWLPFFTKSAFQDSAMTIPAAVGMPVVKMVDVGGTGVVATFANVTLQQDAAGLKYLAFGGVNSGGSTPSINFSGVDKMTVCVGLRKLSDATRGILLELGTGGQVGGFDVDAPQSASAWYSSGMDANATIVRTQGIAAPVTHVFTSSMDRAGANATAEHSLRLNGAAAPSPVVLAEGNTTGNFLNAALNIGQRANATLPLNANVYGIFVRGATAAMTAGQLATLEPYMNRLTGAY